jgi:hypothetical protein
MNITTVQEILQLREWQVCKPMLPSNHSSRWARTQQVGSIVQRKIALVQSCTMLAARIPASADDPPPPSIADGSFSNTNKAEVSLTVTDSRVQCRLVDFSSEV